MGTLIYTAAVSTFLFAQDSIGTSAFLSLQASGPAYFKIPGKLESYLRTTAPTVVLVSRL